MGGHGGLNILPQKRWNGEFLSLCCTSSMVVPACNLGLLDCLHIMHQLLRHQTYADPVASVLPCCSCSWGVPVYGRDNRLKVARDEAAHAAEQAEQQEKHRAAEAQARRQLLLERARQRRAAAGGHADAGAGEDASDPDADMPEQLQGQQQRHARRQAPPDTHIQQEQQQLDFPDSRAHKRRRVQESEQQHELQLQEQQQRVCAVQEDMQQEPVLEHINFWKEFESKTQHPERQVGTRSSFAAMICVVSWLSQLA